MLGREGNSEKAFAIPGVTHVVSAGDRGYLTDLPMEFGSVVSVGGTVLSKSGSTYSEVVWPDTGGGCATHFAKPSWQRDPGCSARTTNDVAAVAWNVAYYDTYSAGGWRISGGTSVAAPIIAGVFGLAGNAGKQEGGKIFWTLTEKQRQEDLHVISSGTDGCPRSCGAVTFASPEPRNLKPTPVQPAGARPTASARFEPEATKKRRLATMRLLLAGANRASAVLLAALLAGCSNTIPGSRALLPGTPDATKSATQHGGGKDAADQFAYVSNVFSNDVSAYSIAASGALTAVAGSPFKAGNGPNGVAIDPTGKFAFVADIDSNDVSAYTIDATSGALKKVKGSPFAAGATPVYVTIEPTGRFAYVPNVGSNDISAYTINATSGALTPVTGSPFKAGVGPYALAVGPSGKFAYVANYGSNTVAAYAIDAASGALRPLTGKPLAAGINPVNVTVDPTGKFAYVASYGSDNIYGYAIDATSGALRPLPASPFADTDSGPENVVVDPTGKFAYVPNSFAPQGFSSHVAAYTIDATRGTLTPVVGSPYKAGYLSYGAAVDSASKFAYVTNAGSNNISAYTINASSGALRKVKGSPFKAGSGAFGISVCRATAGKCIPPPL